MRMSDWSADVCSSDRLVGGGRIGGGIAVAAGGVADDARAAIEAAGADIEAGIGLRGDEALEPVAAAGTFAGAGVAAGAVAGILHAVIGEAGIDAEMEVEGAGLVIQARRLVVAGLGGAAERNGGGDRKSTRLNSSH